jgi:hypothetical protein
VRFSEASEWYRIIDSGNISRCEDGFVGLGIPYFRLTFFLPEKRTSSLSEVRQKDDEQKIS